MAGIFDRLFGGDDTSTDAFANAQATLIEHFRSAASDVSINPQATINELAAEIDTPEERLALKGLLEKSQGGYLQNDSLSPFRSRSELGGESVVEAVANKAGILKP